MVTRHGHPHGHRHGHPNGHQHGWGAAARGGRAFALGAGINLAFVVVQVGYGLAANSMALLADAAHNLADVLALLLAWGAASLTRRPPAGRRTYGWGRSSILAALANAMVLLIGVGAIGVEAVRRFAAPGAGGDADRHAGRRGRHRGERRQRSAVPARPRA